MSTLFSTASSMLGSLKPIPLTIINPKAFGSFYDINNQILLDNAKSIVGGTINNAIDILYSNNTNTVSKLALQGISNILINSIFEANSINNDTLDYFSFRINPTRLSKRRKKIMTQKYTGNGWDVDTRGEEMIVYSYNGSSGSLVAVEIAQKLASIVDNYLKNNNLYDSFLGNITDYFIYNPKLSSAYLKMILFETFWKSNNDDLLIVFEDNAYLGKLQSVEFNQDAMNPYQINYSFDFVVYPEFNYNTNTGWITLEKDTKIRKRFNRIVTNPIKTTNTNIEIANYTIGDKIVNENQITFDTIYDNPVAEMTRRYGMAKFYSKKEDKDNSSISAGEAKQVITNTSSILNLSADIINGNIVWLDGSILNGGIASETIKKRILDKQTNKIKKQLTNLHQKLENMDKNTQYITSGDNTADTDKITPQELATKYTKLSGIDIFEDAISFNLKKPATNKALNNFDPNSIRING